MNWLVRLFIKDKNIDSPRVRASYGALAGWVGIACNLLLFAVKLAAGLLTGSIAITADAVNNLSDAASSVATLIGFILGKKPADPEHPFGHARYEYLAALTVAVLVLVAGVELAKSSFDKILNPQPVTFSVMAMGILLFSILLKSWMAFFVRRLGRRIDSKTLEATAIDSRNDVVVTAVILAGALAAHFAGFPLDGWLGLGVAAFIMYSGVQLVRDTLGPILGQAPDPELVEKVQKKILAYPGVLGTHDLIVHDYGPGRRFASAHVEMDSGVDVLHSHDVIDNIERDFLKQENIHLIIHYDPIVVGDHAQDSARSRVAAALKAIDPLLDMHDFRVVSGPTHDNYIFDVVVPPGYPLGDAALKKQIQRAVQKKGKKIYTVITVDHSYAAMPPETP